MRVIQETPPVLSSMGDEDKNFLTPKGLSLIGGLTEESGSEIRHILSDLETEARQGGQGFIPFVINSGGGDISELLAILDMMSALSLPVATIVEGSAFSAAAILAACGAKGFRYATPSSSYMLHRAWGIAMGKEAEIQVYTEQMRRMEGLVFSRLAKATGKTAKAWKAILKDKGANLYLPPQKAKRMGLVDYVGVPVVTAKVKIEFTIGKSK